MGEDSLTLHVSARKRGKPMGALNPHYPNKSERKKLAQICQKSGLTEQEVRQNKSHRIALAQAARGFCDREDIRNKQNARFQFNVKKAKRLAAKHLGVQPYELVLITHQEAKNSFLDARWPVNYLCTGVDKTSVLSWVKKDNK